MTTRQQQPSHMKGQQAAEAESEDPVRVRSDLIADIRSIRNRDAKRGQELMLKFSELPNGDVDRLLELKREVEDALNEMGR